MRFQTSRYSFIHDEIFDHRRMKQKTSLGRVRPFHIEVAANLVSEIFKGKAPADALINQVFRENRQMGRRDRSIVAETVYDVLRHRRVLEWLMGTEATPRALVLVSLLRQGLLDAGLREHYAELIPYSVDERMTEKPTLPLAVSLSLPDWLVEKWQQELGDEETRALATALNKAAPVDLRVNTLKTDRESLRAQLAAEGYQAKPTPYSPLGLRLNDRSPLFSLQSFKDGLFEIQDEGSQLIGLATGVKPGMRVLDLCAGAGGKTLQMAAMMNNKGSIVACDASPRRLSQLKPRLARAGVSNIQILPIAHENDAKLTCLRGSFDVVLVDAPCSGTGTLRRNPDIKWREIDLEQLYHIQTSLLEAAGRLVAPGGRVIYATCSLLQQENADIVKAFLTKHADFAAMPLSLPESIRPRAQEAPVMLQLYPHRHGTDGFFMACLQRGQAG